jgi:hypothetical protein
MADAIHQRVKKGSAATARIGEHMRDLSVREKQVEILIYIVLNMAVTVLGDTRQTQKLTFIEVGCIGHL